MSEQQSAPPVQAEAPNQERSSGRLLADGPAGPRFWVPTVAISVVLTAAALALSRESWPATAALALFAASSGLLGAIDIREHRLPDVITKPLALACAVLLTAAAWMTGDWGRLGMAGACAAAATVVFFILFVLGQGQLGFGDVKLMLSVGLVLGWQGPTVLIVSITLGLILALVSGIVMIVLGKLAGLRAHLALGPYLLIGALLLAILTY